MKVIRKILNAILSVVLVFIIQIIYAGINVEVSERLSYAWLVLAFGGWAIALFIRRRKRTKPDATSCKPIAVANADQIPRKEEQAQKEKRSAEYIYDLVVIDFETTGLNSNFLNDRMDEILSVAIIDQDGNTLLSTLCGTSNRKTWAKAEEIHGISPAMVKGLPTFSDILPQVKDILYKARKVIAYNIPFEMGFLWSYDAMNDFPGGTKIREMVEWGEDPMLMYAAYKGEITKYDDFKWHKLTAAAQHFKYPFKAHDALEDVKATLHVYKALLKYVAAYDDKEYILKYGKSYRRPGN